MDFMAHVILITGAARSGKSILAITMGETLGKRRVFVATCVPFDEELTKRIERHKRERKGRNWDTFEEPTEVTAALLRTSAYDVRVVDCLTLWVNNLIYQEELTATSVDEDFISQRCQELLEVCANLSGTVILVTNEVGSGIIPDNPLARRFRDLLGLLNRLVAQQANQVIMTICGLPLHLKKGPEP